MVPGIIGAILLTLIGDLTALSFVKEREQGTLEQLVVTPLSGFALLLGKTIPFLLIGMLNVLNHRDSPAGFGSGCGSRGTPFSWWVCRASSS